MVVQVRADAGSLSDDRHPRAAEDLRVADARAHQEQWIGDGARREHDGGGVDRLQPSVALVPHADHAPAVDQEGVHRRSVQEVEVGPTERRIEEGVGGGHAPPVRYRQRVRGRPDHLAAVVIRDAVDTEPDPGVEVVGHQRAAELRTWHDDR